MSAACAAMSVATSSSPRPRSTDIRNAGCPAPPPPSRPRRATRARSSAPIGRRTPGEVLGVPVTSPLERARLRQPVLGELADGLEEAVAGAGRGVVGDEERLSDQRVEMPEHVHVVGPVDHGADARQVEAAGEDRREAEQLPLVVGQEVVGPLHRMAERELSFRPRYRSLQQPESIGESIPDLDRAHRRHSGGGQLDAQREPVEGLADLGHRGRGIRLRRARSWAGRLGLDRRTA